MENNETLRLTFSDEKSNKFWEITHNDESIITTYGKIGTDGQQSRKSFESVEKAIKERDKLIKEKLGKGYQK